ncbi:MAG TPA: DUF1549 domain-containing protein [Verrucomicrobiae bacterium]|jgi:hypothetical protein|nr:DUF1549 domain-containing protein [Verrucomicrobiae bacterium]
MFHLRQSLGWMLACALAAAAHGATTNDDFIARRNERLAALPPAPASWKNASIDSFITAKWDEAHLPEAKTPPPLCDDATFARRLYLDLIGIIPSAAESRAFVADKRRDKRTKLAEALLARNEDYAAHWTPFWEDALASQSTAGGVATHGDYGDFIYRSFVTNKPYDLFVAELLDPTMPGYKHANVQTANTHTNVNGFVRTDTHSDTIQTAANTAQIFMATEMKCASCHNHFLNKEWPQKRFTAFAGLFSTNDLEVIRCEKHMGEFVPAAFPFDAPGAPTNVPSTQEARLHYLTTRLIDPCNERFSQAIVNRLWKRFVGLGLVEPVDDFRSDREPSHPELLHWLADDFMRHGYDLKHTIALIVTSRTYQQRYNPALEDTFNMQKPDAPRYVRSPSLRRLTAEQVIDSIHKAAAPGWSGPRLYRDAASTALTRALGRPPTRNEVSTSRPDDVAVVQSLEMLNGPELYHFVYDGEILDEWASQKDQKKVVRELYWTVLNRPPTAGEMALGLKYLQDNVPGAAPLRAKTAETVWVDGDLPPGARADLAAWRWVEGPAYPVFGGTRAHMNSASVDKAKQQHLVTDLPPVKFERDDRLFAYVYLEPTNAPAEIMVQWNQNGWEHRAFWGEDKIGYGDTGPSRRKMGALPKAGEWVRLEIPVREVGLNPDETISGISFDQSGGTVYWDKAGLEHRPPHPETEPLGDMMWALVVSPEFQFIR